MSYAPSQFSRVEVGSGLLLPLSFIFPLVPVSARRSLCWSRLRPAPFLAPQPFLGLACRARPATLLPTHTHRPLASGLPLSRWASAHLSPPFFTLLSSFLPLLRFTGRLRLTQFKALLPRFILHVLTTCLPYTVFPHQSGSSPQLSSYTSTFGRRKSERRRSPMGGPRGPPDKAKSPGGHQFDHPSSLTQLPIPPVSLSFPLACQPGSTYTISPII